MTGTRKAGILLALCTAIISGFAIFINGNYVQEFGSATVYTTAKNLIAASVLIAVVVFGRRVGASLTRPSGARQWSVLAVIAILGGAVPFVLFFEGLAKAAEAGTTGSAFLHKSLVLWVAVFAVVFLREKMAWWHYAAITLLVAGQLGLNGGFDVALLTSSGPVMILAATMLWAIEAVITKNLLKDVSPWTTAMARMAGGSVILLSWIAIRGDLGAVIPSTGQELGWLLLVGLLLAGYVVTWHNALARAQVIDVSAVLVLGALVTAALNGVFAGSGLLPDLQWYGLMIAGGGLLVSQAMRRLAPVVGVPA